METNITNYLRIKASILEAKQVLHYSKAIDNELKAIYKALQPKHTQLHEVLLEVANELQLEVVI